MELRFKILLNKDGDNQFDAEKVLEFAEVAVGDESGITDGKEKRVIGLSCDQCL